jgi:hypothetical protein
MAGSGLMSTQKAEHPHLAPQGTRHGLEGEVGDLRKDVSAQLAPLAAITVEEFTNPATAAINAIKLAIASVAAAVTYSAAQLDGAVGQGVLNPPRNITVTTAGTTPADAPATATINGIDVNGKAISETITVSQTAATAAGAKAFSKVTSIVLPVADGAGATLAFGFGAIIGLGKKIKSRAGLAFLLKEAAGGAVVTNGVIVAATTGLPNGTYAPNSAPNGATTYAVYYEYDPTV